MSKKIVKCKKCHQEILQANPANCPYCGSKEFVSEEESAQMEIQEADLKTGKVKSISLECPYCGATLSISSKSEEVTCLMCKKKYEVPQKACELFQLTASHKTR
jgi:DNA-directed RNA polymerase subunit RPC12/RpoP